jgi:hypothetical protein
MVKKSMKNKVFPCLSQKQKVREETVQSILNLGTRCRCVVTVLLYSRERVAGTDCVGPVAVHEAFLGVLEEKKSPVSVTSLTTDH